MLVGFGSTLELAKKPAACLEYILVHEMVYLLEQHHNVDFENSWIGRCRGGAYAGEWNQAPLAGP